MSDHRSDRACQPGSVCVWENNRLRQLGHMKVCTRHAEGLKQLCITSSGELKKWRVGFHSVQVIMHHLFWCGELEKVVSGGSQHVLSWLDPRPQTLKTHHLECLNLQRASRP